VSVTYAAHAALITGAHPATTGIWGNHTWLDGGWVPAPPAGPRAPTLFDRAAAAGVRSVLVAGDQHLVPQMGGDAADEAWPPAGVLPDGTSTCTFGYATDDEVVARLTQLDLGSRQGRDRDGELVVIHLNEPDTAAHRFGPDSAEALERYRATDAAYGQLLDVLADRWHETVCVTVSDHDQEAVAEGERVDLAGALAGAEGVTVVHEGTAALLHGPVEAEAVRAVNGVEAVVPLSSEIWSAWTEPGRVFGRGPIRAHGQHGSPRCRAQVAVISGGHPAVDRLARGLERDRPTVFGWAPLAADLLGLAPLP
jgi:hypothetical protein